MLYRCAVDVFFESGPSDGGRAHRTRFGVGVYGEFAPGGENLAGSHISLLEYFGACVDGTYLAVYGGVTCAEVRAPTNNCVGSVVYDDGTVGSKWTGTRLLEKSFIGLRCEDDPVLENIYLERTTMIRYDWSKKNVESKCRKRDPPDACISLGYCTEYCSQRGQTCLGRR